MSASTFAAAASIRSSVATLSAAALVATDSAAAPVASGAIAAGISTRTPARMRSAAPAFSATAEVPPFALVMTPAGWMVAGAGAPIDESCRNPTTASLAAAARSGVSVADDRAGCGEAVAASLVC